jgi:hypothetical protein
MENNVGPIVGMVIAVTFILTAGGVALLRPIAKQLGAYLRALTEERKRVAPTTPTASQPMLQALERIEHRLSVLEERQEFAEDLIRSRHPNPALSPPKE